MDPLHAKAVSDLHQQAQMSDDAFYDRYSCEGLHWARRVIAKFWPVQRVYLVPSVPRSVSR